MYFGIEDENISLFLEQLIDGPDNELTIFVANSEKRPFEESFIADGNKQVLNILSNAMKLAPDYSQLYKIHFENYIMYQTANESYCSYNPDEIRLGKGLIVFTKSRLLDFLEKFIIVDLVKAHNTKFKHYGVYTLSHIIDVISPVEPTVEKVTLTDIKFAK